MSSQKYASPLVLKPKTSIIFYSVFFIAHLGAMASVLSLNWHWAWKIILLIILFVSLATTLKKGGVGAIRSMTWKDGPDWAIEFRNNTHYETQLLPSSFVSPWLVVLNFKKTEEQPRRSVTLFRDALDGESFRRLRVRLGMEGTGKEVSH